jgi:hypothetical protein
MPEKAARARRPEQECGQKEIKIQLGIQEDPYSYQKSVAKPQDRRDNILDI